MKSLLLHILTIAFAVSTSYATLERVAFDCNIQPSFKQVFELGFRPSFVGQYSDDEVRDWNLRPLKIQIGKYEYNCVTEMTTLKVFDTGMLSRLTVVADRNSPIPVEDAFTEAQAILHAGGMKEDPVAEWRAKFKKKGAIRFEGSGITTANNINVSVALYPHGAGDKFASLVVTIEWPYEGKLSTSGRRTTPLRTPDGYEWDMSVEEWSRRLRERRKKEAKQVVTPNGP